MTLGSRGGGLAATALAVLACTGVLAGCSSGEQSPGTTDARASSSTPSSTTGATRPSSPDDATQAPPAAAPHRVEVTTLPWRLPQPVAREAAIDGPRGIVVAGGLVAGDESTSAAYVLDVATGGTHRLRALPVPVHDVGGVLTPGGYLVIGGGNATEQDVVQRLASGSAWAEGPSLPQPRSDLVAVTDRAEPVVVGGYDGTSPALADVLVGTRRGGWSVLGQLAVPVRYAAVGLVGRTVWVFGGERDGAMVDTIQRVDLDTGHVRVAGQLARPLGHATALAVGGRVLIVGGRTAPTALTSRMWWFDPRSGRLHAAGRLPTPLADTAVVRQGSAAYLVGGETPDLSDRVRRISVS